MLVTLEYTDSLDEFAPGVCTVTPTPRDGARAKGVASTDEGREGVEMVRRGRVASARGATGRVEISRASIAHGAVMQSYGVVGLAPSGLRGNLAYYLGQDDPRRGIEVSGRVYAWVAADAGWRLTPLPGQGCQPSAILTYKP